ncbi:MAG: type II toxin-antitoxin system RelE family toxin [Candidatus Bathyarchaeia archaeon]
MTFKVLLDPRATKALRKLDEVNKSRIKKALGELAGDPYEAGEPLHPSDYWKIRGDYRAIFKIYSDKKEVKVLFIGHRKNVYDDFTKII